MRHVCKLRSVLIVQKTQIVYPTQQKRWKVVIVLTQRLREFFLRWLCISHKKKVNVGNKVRAHKELLLQIPTAGGYIYTYSILCKSFCKSNLKRIYGIFLVIREMSTKYTKYI